MIKDLIFVGLGGCAGSMLRFLTARFSSRFISSARFISSDWSLVGTFIANIVGCFLIGLFAGWLLTHTGKNQSLYLLLITGFCGGYTTFSTFAFENVQLWQSGNYLASMLYVVTSIVLGLLAVWLGLKLN